MQLDETQISERLRRTYRQDDRPEIFFPQYILVGKPHPAAVLIPFVCIDDEWHILFIRRTLNEKDRHGGQVAFPGGRCEPSDLNPETTAKREACEEVGLNPGDIRILGRLNDMMTITNYRVTPIVGVIPWPYNFHPQPTEVSRIFTIPLAFLADPANQEVRDRAFRYQDKPLSVIYFSAYDGETLWGASARMMLKLLKILGLN
jgi:8-oxo-dGTP pyrophosphatase MutT (NUDIX family)